MENLTQSIMVAIMIVVFILLVVEIFNILIKMRLNQKEIELEKYNIELNTSIEESIIVMLDNLINTIFEDYIILNIACQNILYITPELEQKISKEISYKISERISPIMIIRLSTYYNKDSIGDIIAEKVYMKTLNYVVNQNKSKDENPKSLK